MLVIKNARIFTAAERNYEKGDIIVDNGKITAVGTDAAIHMDAASQKEAEIIDAEGLFAMPGIVDAHSHIGGFGANGDDQDLNEMTCSVTPSMESYYAINPDSKDFKRAIRTGITTSVIAPGSGNVIGGLVCACKSAGKNVSEMCIKNPVALKMALGGNPKGVYGVKKQLPMTRMGIAQVIRDQFYKAREYMKKQADAGEDISKLPPYDAGMENICRVLRREIPAKVHCEQFDMLTALRISEEFDVLITLDHAWGSSDFIEEISSAKNLVGVIFGPVGVPLLPGECGKVDIECLAELDRRGVTCAIMTDGPILNPEMIIVQAGEAVRTGTPHDRALRMLTINPAKIAGLDDRIGSLEPGKDADIVLFRGIPALDSKARCVMTVINGVVVYRA